MWHKTEWTGRPMRLELTRVGLLIQLSISTQFKCKYNLIVKNISISSYSV